MSAEPCVYERLWESIVVLRESGHRYGMSERDIERFIKQVLQTNEPQDQEQDEDHTPFSLLRATAKFAAALFFLLLLVLCLSQPLSLSASPPSLSPSPPPSPSLSLSLSLNCSCLEVLRLLDLPIAHKYKLHDFTGLFSLLVQSTQKSSVCAPPQVYKTEDEEFFCRADEELQSLNCSLH